MVSAVAITVSLFYFYFNPSASRYFPPCIFLSLTGFTCPGCGSQRAFHALLHGEIKQAADFNLLFMSFLPFIFYSAAIKTNNLFRRMKWKQNLFYSTVFVRIILILVLFFWVLRNIPFYPFTWLAPWAIWWFGNLVIWRWVDLEIWQFGDLEIRKYWILMKR